MNKFLDENGSLTKEALAIMKPTETCGWEGKSRELCEIIRALEAALNDMREDRDDERQRAEEFCR